MAQIMVCTRAQDAVPRVAKFGNLFRRPGQRVIVDYQGDIVVRPSPHEIHLRSGAAHSVLRRPVHWLLSCTGTFPLQALQLRWSRTACVIE